MNIERLKKLANHLLTGKLGHKNFTLESWNFDFGHHGPGPYCGTSGCAIGECPIIFPEDWRYDIVGDPTLIERYYGNPWDASTVYFDLSKSENEYLFCIQSYSNQKETTKEEVAERILNFIKDNETLTDSQLSS